MSELANLDDLLGADDGITARNMFNQELSAHRQFPGAWPADTITISAGQITPSHAFSVVRSSGDINTISTENTHDGMELKLLAGDGLAVTVKHNPDDSGGVSLNGGVDLALPDDRYVTLKRYGDRWQEIVPYGANLEAGGTWVTSEELAEAVADIKEGEWLPVAGDDAPGIVQFATEQELTAENTTQAVPASMHFALYVRTATVEGRAAIIDTRLATVEDAVSTTDVGSLAIRIGIAESDITSQGIRIATLEAGGGGVTAEQLDAVVVRVTALEASLGSIDTALDAIIGEAI